MKNKPTPLLPLVSYLNEFLRTGEITDYSGAVNGLQIANSGQVARIVSAVDACEAVISEAARVPGTLLLAHHGIYWQGVQPVTGALYRKMRVALSLIHI